MNTAQSEYTYFEQNVGAAKPNDQASLDLQKDFVSKGPKYVALSDQLKIISGAGIGLSDTGKKIAEDITNINDAMKQAFSYINELYDISASPALFTIPIAYFTGNESSQFSVSIAEHYAKYSVEPPKNPTSDNPAAQPDGTPSGANAPAHPPQPPVKGADTTNPFDKDGSVTKPHLRYIGFEDSGFSPISSLSSDKPKATKKPCPAQACPQQSPTPAPVIYTSPPFEVHKFYRANLVAGFFASSLRNRQYGLTNNGQASSTSNPGLRPGHWSGVSTSISRVRRN